jgi:hypothetical protein
VPAALSIRRQRRQHAALFIWLHVLVLCQRKSGDDGAVEQFVVPQINDAVRDAFGYADNRTEFEFDVEYLTDLDVKTNGAADYILKLNNDPRNLAARQFIAAHRGYY